MSKAPPPLLGFNNNVRHRGRIFHIQTEDSGVKFPRIVTHLFADGGRIMKTTRTDYSDHIGKDDMAVVVRAMMKEQHKAMFAALRAGTLDDVLEEACGPLDPPSATMPASRPSELSSVSQLKAAPFAGAGRSTLPAAESPAPAAAVQSSLPPAHRPSLPSASSLSSMPASAPSFDSAQPPPTTSRPLGNPNLRKPTPSALPPGPDAFDFELGALVPRSEPVELRPRDPQTPPPPPRRSRPAQPRPTPPVESTAASPLGRPSPRPAALPAQSARSIFGDGAISEQSLDEVILSYLAEDLDEQK